MTNAYERLKNCFACIEGHMPFKPQIALILGSGLGDYAETLDIRGIIEYKEIAGFPISTVSGHKGQFVFAYVEEIPVVIMQGRVHYYEGYTMEDVVLPVRLMKMMGAETLFLTNAAGGANVEFQVGDFMLITDHIGNFVPSPLIGPNIEELGVRFCDMSHVYDIALQDMIKEAAKESGIEIQEGVYIQLTGPNYETPMEVKMCRSLGSDAIGMSTVCEAIAGNHMEMKICGISCITNMACGILKQPLSHEEVKVTADRVAPLFKKLVTESIIRIGKTKGI